MKVSKHPEQPATVTSGHVVPSYELPELVHDIAAPDLMLGIQLSNVNVPPEQPEYVLGFAIFLRIVLSEEEEKSSLTE